MIPYQFLITVRLGFKSLKLHKLRSALTMLGIIFGVCSVIAMLAIGEGASYEAQEAIKRLGSNNILIRSLKPPEQARQQGAGGRRGFQIKYGLTYDDAGRLLGTIPGVSRVLPMRIIRENVRFQRTEIPCQVIGTLPFYPEVAGATLVRGRFLAYYDEEHMENVCVITTGLARQLFPYQDPLNHAIKIATFYYRVIGIVQERSQPEQRSQAGKMEGQPLDNNVYKIGRAHV